MAGEGAVEDLPLHRVGVLELVDEHHPPALPHPAAGRRRLVGQRVGQLAQQVVVAEDAEPALAPVELGPHRSGERHPPPGDGVPGRRRGLQPGLRVTGGGRGDGARLGAVELGNRWLAGEPAHVHVVDHLGDELVEVLDEPRAGVGVAGDPQPGQHHLAELVGRRDGGAVERGEGLAHPRVTGGDLVRAAGEEQPSSGSIRGSGVAGGRAGSTARTRSAATSCSRTRSRSSSLAARPKVTTSSSSRRQCPSAT